MSIRRRDLEMTPNPQSSDITARFTQVQQQSISQQQTALQPAVSAAPEPVIADSLLKLPLKRKSTRIIAIIITLALAVVLYFIWHTPASTTPLPGISQQNFRGTSSNSSASTGSSTTTGADIHVYVVGAVKHPGVYTLPSGARVYQLLQAAGGALPNANLVALNLAAQLSDGQEVYVLVK